MMIIKNVKWQLEDATRPISKLIKGGDTFKSMAIGLTKGVTWKDHKAVLPTKLLVIEGKVMYRQEGTEVVLKKYDDMDIPVNLIHSLEALRDSICVLIQG
jgi:quercetin dioxygenase-like cupin family protein